MTPTYDSYNINNDDNRTSRRISIKTNYIGNIIGCIYTNISKQKADTRYDNDYNESEDDYDDNLYCSANENNSILYRVKQRFNLLEYDVKQLVAYAESLLCTVRNHEQTIYRMNNDLNEMHSQIIVQKQRARDAEIKCVELSKYSPEDNTCCICMTNPRDMVYINCGHLCICLECEKRLDEKCPICRTNGRAINIIIS
jgi:hypothetical protein